jgi:hypothetical protein
VRSICGRSATALFDTQGVALDIGRHVFMRRIHVVGLVAIAILLSSCGSDDEPTSAPSSGAVSTASSTAVSTVVSTTTDTLGHEVTASSTAGASTVGDPICDAEQHCMYPLTITATVSGDLTGTTVSHSAGALVGTDFAASDTMIFTGTVAGCGTGTLVFLSTGRGSTTGTTTSTWTIAEGFGTGDLVHATGTGTTRVPPASSGSAPATLTGRITCE